MNDPHSSAAAILERSRIVRVAARAMMAVHAAAATSRAWRPVIMARRRWRAGSLQERRRFAGVMLMTAAAVNLLLSLLQPPAPGWLWPVLPCAAAAIGLVLVAAARRDV